MTRDFIFKIRCIDAMSSSSISELLQIIRSDPSDATLISNFNLGENNENFLEISRGLGKMTLNGIEFEGNNLEQNVIHSVQYVEGGLYDDELLLYSSTNNYFPCHTDDSCSLIPATGVLLYCVEPALKGGDTLLVHINNILSHLSLTKINKLKLPIYPFQFGLAPILKENNQNFEIRYNRIEINRFSKILQTKFDFSKSALLDELDDILYKEAINNKFILKNRDCLILNNTKILHGRTAFNKKSKRLLKRIRVYLV